MQKSGNLEQQPVLAAEMHRDDPGPCLARQQRYGSAPGRIGDATRAHIEVRHLAGGKHHERAISLEPAQRIAHGPGVTRDALLAEHLDGQQHGLELMQRTQILVREHLEVRTQVLLTRRSA